MLVNGLYYETFIVSSLLPYEAMTKAATSACPYFSALWLCQCMEWSFDAAVLMARGSAAKTLTHYSTHPIWYPDVHHSSRLLYIDEKKKKIVALRK